MGFGCNPTITAKATLHASLAAIILMAYATMTAFLPEDAGFAATSTWRSFWGAVAFISFCSLLVMGDEYLNSREEVY